MAEHLSAEPEEVLTSLLGLLENVHPRVRLYAAEALHRSFDPHRAWSTTLQESRLALFKGEFGDSEMSPIYIALAEGAVPVLARALNDDQPFVRAHAAATLGKLGVDAAEAGPALRNRLEDNDPIVRFWVRHALGRSHRLDGDEVYSILYGSALRGLKSIFSLLKLGARSGRLAT